MAIVQNGLAKLKELRLVQNSLSARCSSTHSEQELNRIMQMRLLVFEQQESVATVVVQHCTPAHSTKSADCSKRAGAQLSDYEIVSVYEILAQVGT